MKNLLLFVAMLFVVNVHASNFIDPEFIILPKEQPFGVGINVDGVWVGPGNVTLIKQLKGYIILQGMDNMSTWSAKGIIKNNQIICRGNGVTNSGVHFIYESTLTLKESVLIDEWRANFPDNKVLEGKDNLNRVKLEELGNRKQKSR